mmetsp:Transcript_681/g.1425  ORF Transcript_681/g.1425 Transcript_681/m.1425 type:complete len:700 (-) Transcript_681:143-2242(-)
MASDAVGKEIWKTFIEPPSPTGYAYRRKNPGTWVMYDPAACTAVDEAIKAKHRQAVVVCQQLQYIVTILDGQPISQVLLTDTTGPALDVVKVAQVWFECFDTPSGQDWRRCHLQDCLTLDCQRRRVLNGLTNASNYRFIRADGQEAYVAQISTAPYLEFQATGTRVNLRRADDVGESESMSCKMVIGNKWEAVSRGFWMEIIAGDEPVWWDDQSRAQRPECRRQWTSRLNEISYVADLDLGVIHFPTSRTSHALWIFGGDTMQGLKDLPMTTCPWRNWFRMHISARTTPGKQVLTMRNFEDWVRALNRRWEADDKELRSEGLWMLWKDIQLVEGTVDEDEWVHFWSLEGSASSFFDVQVVQERLRRTMGRWIVHDLIQKFEEYGTSAETDRTILRSHLQIICKQLENSDGPTRQLAASYLKRSDAQQPGDPQQALSYFQYVCEIMNFRELTVKLCKLDLRSHLPAMVRQVLPEMNHGVVMVDDEKYEFGTSNYFFQDVIGLGSTADFEHKEMSFGTTLRTHSEIAEKWRQLKPEFKQTYNVFANNCNHFCGRLLHFLVGSAETGTEVHSLRSSAEYAVNAWWFPIWRMMCPQHVEMCEKYVADLRQEEDRLERERLRAVKGQIVLIVSPKKRPRIAKILDVAGDDLRLRAWALRLKISDETQEVEVEERCEEVPEKIYHVQFCDDRVPLPSGSRTPVSC